VHDEIFNLKFLINFIIFFKFRSPFWKLSVNLTTYIMIELQLNDLFVYLESEKKNFNQVQMYNGT